MFGNKQQLFLAHLVLAMNRENQIASCEVQSSTVILLLPQGFGRSNLSRNRDGRVESKCSRCARSLNSKKSRNKLNTISG